MNLRSLGYFVALAEELSFTRAALRSNIEQAALSQAIRRLESEIGVKLFDRSTRGVALTPGGTAFVPAAKSALELLSTGLRDAKSIHCGKRGILRVGYVATAAFDVLPNLLRSFRSDFPEIEFDLRQLDSEEQLELLTLGELDCSLIRPRSLSSEFSVTPIVREPFICIVPTSHRLANRNSVSMQELTDEDFVVLPSEPATSFSSVIASIFDDAGFSPRVVQRTRLFTTIVGLVSAGLGISIVPSSVRTMDLSGVAFLGLSGVVKQAGLDFVWRRQSGSPLLKHLVREVERQFEGEHRSGGHLPQAQPMTSSAT